MDYVHASIGIAVVSSMLLASLIGLVCWLRSSNSQLFWKPLRAAQAILFLQVGLGATLMATGKEPPELHMIYGLLPLGVMFVAEQLRVSAAQMVLDQRGFESAQDVGKLPQQEQRLVVRSIMRREVGVMALAAFVTALLAMRAGATSGGFLI